MPKTAAAAANSAAARTGVTQSSYVANRSQVQGTLPPGFKSICIGADGTSGCRNEQQKIYWQLDQNDQLFFVTQPHFGCSCCFRPCVRAADGSWQLGKGVKTTSAPTAAKMIERRRNAGLPL